MTPASGSVRVHHSKGGVHVIADESDDVPQVEARLTPERARTVAWAMIAAADDAEKWQREHPISSGLSGALIVGCIGDEPEGTTLRERTPEEVDARCIDDHCPICGEYESECTCEEDADGVEVRTP